MFIDQKTILRHPFFLIQSIKSMYYHSIPHQALFFFFCRISKLAIKFKYKCKGPRIAKTILKNKIGDLPYLTLKLIMIYTNQDGVIDIRVNM